MCQKEALKALPTSSEKRGMPLIVHTGIIFLLGVLFSYLFLPHYGQLAFVLAGVLWYMTWHDYVTQEIDIRWIAVFLIVGLAIHNQNPLFYLYVALMGFFLPHIIHEAAAKIVDAQEDEGSFHYDGVQVARDGSEKAPAYLPIFTATLMAVLAYYLLALPLPDSLYHLIFEPVRVTIMPASLWLLPLLCAGISFYFYRRNKRAMKAGKNILYRGFGDGDIYFFGAMAGTIGFFLTLLTVTLSMIPAWFILRRFKRQTTSSQEA